ncbi:MAG: tetratricopeptide repeat protein [Sphingobium sp.]
MTIIQTLRATVAAAALILLPSVTVRAQSSIFTSDAEAGRALSQALNTLSSDPQNVRALIEAGNAALALDDTNGALGFFARAEEIDPRNGRIKTGLARAMLMTERPREALKLFNDAVGLGIPEGEIAGDRGLAYDLRGDTRRAQRDYQTALRHGQDAEVTRRLALSYAIGGDREQAMQTLDPLLRIQDRAAWRARAFIMAIGGDLEGANGVARTVMPANLAVPMGPFFARLPSLSASQKAAAVHFGRIPSDGKTRQVLASADIDTRPPQPSARTSVPMSEPMDSGHEAENDDAPATAPPVQVSREPRRRPGAPVALAARSEPARPAPAATMPSRAPASSATRTAPPVSKPMSDLAPAVPVTRELSPAPGFSLPVTAPARQDEPERLAQAASTPSVAVTAALPPRAEPTVPAPPPSSPATPLERSLASIVQGLELEQVEAVPMPVPAARRPATPAVTKDADEPVADVKAAADKKAADKKAADKKAADKKEADRKAAEKKAAAKPDPKKLHPERIWAQIATGASKGALVTDYGKLVKKSPAAFKGMTGWTVPFKATRRLLVGPFPTAAKASDFLKKAGITGFAWTSPAGTEIEKLGGR